MASSSKDLNFATHNALKQEVKSLRGQCKETYLAITNNVAIEQNINSDNKREKTLCYMDGLRADLAATETPVNLDENNLTLQFLNDLKTRIAEVEQLIAYKERVVSDKKQDILRLRNLIKTCKEAKSKSISVREVKPVYLEKAKQQFHSMKTSLNQLIYSMYPTAADNMIEILAELMQEQLKASSDGYIEITSESYHIVQMLLDMDIVACSPYDKKKIKLCVN